MTLHPPKLKKKPRPERRPPAPLTIGHVLGEQLRAKRDEEARAKADKERRAELDAQGFTPIKSAP